MPSGARPDDGFLDAELRQRLLALGAQVAITARQRAVPVVAG